MLPIAVESYVIPADGLWDGQALWVIVAKLIRAIFSVSAPAPFYIKAGKDFPDRLILIENRISPTREIDPAKNKRDRDDCMHS